MPTPRTAALVLGGLLLTAVAACGASSGSDGTDDPRPTTTSTAQPVDDLDADSVVWQEDEAGGFVPLEYSSGRVPTVTIYADGRIFVQVADPSGRAGGPVALEQRQIPDHELDAFLAHADASGLFEPGTDFGSPGVTDQTSTTVTLRTGDTPKQIDVYALDLAYDAPEGDVTDQQATRREQLLELLAAARELGTADEPYVPDRVRAEMLDPSVVVSPPTSGTPWPGPPFSVFPEPVEGASSSCLVIEGPEAEATYRAAQARPDNSDHAWDLDGDIRTVVLTPLLPGQEGCPPA